MRDGIGCARPFTVGSRYWDAPRRVVIVGINPEAGSTDAWKTPAYKQARKLAIERFKAGDDGALAQYALDAEVDVPLWGNGKYMARIERLGLALPDIAMGDIALCATQSNKYPGDFLRRCFGTHTTRRCRSHHRCQPSGVPIEKRQVRQSRSTPPSHGLK